MNSDERAAQTEGGSVQTEPLDGGIAGSLKTANSMQCSFSWQKAARWIFFLAAALLITMLYRDFGTDSEVIGEDRSIFGWVMLQWGHENFKYNWVMLIFSAYLIWKDREELSGTESSYSLAGAGIVFVSILAHIFGYRTQMPRISLAALVVAYWGAVYAAWGRRVAVRLIFPAGYALLCFTSSLLTEITWPLRMMASQISVTLLHGAGIEAARQGTIVYSSAGGGFSFNVADACSGLRSLSAMVALAAPYAYLTMHGFWSKWILFAMSIPLAMLANALRIFTLGLIAEWIGMELAMTLYHDLSGFLVLFISLGLLMLTGSIIEKIERRFG